MLTSTWATKKEPNGDRRERLTTEGYAQIKGEHCDTHNVSSPVKTDVAIRIVLVLMIMASWESYLPGMN